MPPREQRTVLIDEASAGERVDVALAKLLGAEIQSGATKEYETAHNEWRASLPRETCEWCEGTGIRTDEVGVEHGMPTKELNPEVAILTGRTHGWCNGCQGEGTKESWLASYPFTVENVQEFADFLFDSGGFSIC